MMINQYKVIVSIHFKGIYFYPCLTYIICSSTQDVLYLLITQYDIMFLIEIL